MPIDKICIYILQEQLYIDVCYGKRPRESAEQCKVFFARGNDMAAGAGLAKPVLAGYGKTILQGKYERGTLQLVKCKTWAHEPKAGHRKSLS